MPKTSADKILAEYVDFENVSETVELLPIEITDAMKVYAEQFIEQEEYGWRFFEQKMNECYEEGDKENAEIYKAAFLALHKQRVSDQIFSRFDEKIDNTVEFAKENIKRKLRLNGSILEELKNEVKRNNDLVESRENASFWKRLKYLFTRKL